MVYDEAQESHREGVRNLRSLKRNIDAAARQIVTANHNFQSKLHDAQTVIYYLIARYGDARDIQDFLEQVLAEIKSVIEILQVHGKGFLYIVVEEQATAKELRKGVFKFKQEILSYTPGQRLSRKRIELKDADKILLQLCHEHYKKMVSLFEDGENLFILDMEKTEIVQVKVELGLAGRHFKKFMEGLLKYIVIYEQILRTALAELEK